MKVIKKRKIKNLLILHEAKVQTFHKKLSKFKAHTRTWSRKCCSKETCFDSPITNKVIGYRLIWSRLTNFLMGLGARISLENSFASTRNNSYYSRSNLDCKRQKFITTAPTAIRMRFDSKKFSQKFPFFWCNEKRCPKMLLYEFIFQINFGSRERAVELLSWNFIVWQMGLKESLLAKTIPISDSVWLIIAIARA